jgi:hypothetical protein
MNFLCPAFNAAKGGFRVAVAVRRFAMKIKQDESYGDGNYVNTEKTLTCRTELKSNMPQAGIVVRTTQRNGYFSSPGR